MIRHPRSPSLWMRNQKTLLTAFFPQLRHGCNSVHDGDDAIPVATRHHSVEFLPCSNRRRGHAVVDRVINPHFAVSWLRSVKSRNDSTSPTRTGLPSISKTPLTSS